jgi:alkane 1-monooxygenase
MSRMPVFALATLIPLALILTGLAFGGPWAWMALASVTIVVAGLDHLVRRTLPAGSDSEFPAGDGLAVSIAVGHIALVVLMMAALTGGWLTMIDKLVLFVATVQWLGQVGNSNAHELIHRGNRTLHRLGVLAYVTVLFGHHASAHPLVHHVRVATRSDPSTARKGESLYRFIGRAWRGSFREGFRAEQARLIRTGRPGWRNPYVVYVGGAVVMMAQAVWIGGLAGLGIYLALALMAQGQLLMSDYVQHYGLMRAMGPNGKPVPVGPRHSWNAPHPASSAFMLNAPRHSDHHAHPARPYPTLRLPDPADAPHLPRSLPVMATLALFPPLWRRVMDPLAAAWEGR